MIDTDDSIVAIATPTVPAWRGVVRLSGSDAVDILVAAGVDIDRSQSPRRFAADIDVGPPLGSISVDILLWPTTRSYSGQPSAELHTYGALPVLQALVDTLIAAGARAARPGEFTLRAFLNGRLDLTQAEAVLGVIEAETAGSLNHALQQLAGNLSRPLHQLRGELLDLLADVEAGLDFVDEDIQFITDQQLTERLRSVHLRLHETAQTIQTRSGGGTAVPTVVLCGRPNAGKSSLLNRLAGQDAAIVACTAGTTRDAVSLVVELEGHRVRLIDTAGIDAAGSEIDAASQQQASQAACVATLRLWCVDCSADDTDQEARLLADRAAASRTRDTIDLWVRTKSDLADSSAGPTGWIQCSAASGAGIESLRRCIADQLDRHDREETGSVIGTAARSRQSIQHALQAIAAAIGMSQNQTGHEFVATELRTAAECLGEVTGTVYTDDILDRVFNRFCIGK